ncbi:MAG: 23S rRNA (adenine(2030)-N(6))-methyltransferase RlmJ [Moraxellaceae bacterium]|jgi:23S rRNA (adenine2030-N6)-methyltransferase|nr:23S rRNA (adenine(2030)-N(6))-methyltransferase RlmJ [Moraxellaceae bacterium]MBP7229235.1 23S rRNA (adenine(2030)-N(6))-methyltransferase RlmJ [Moraxellaceae bacterium]MBP9731232.1 23S rRNA (adenine(2030)-N(6))-methyltransferase RlmJ [Moraxellaceae bacterium]HQV41593.1 23S rRNA (adenine(2030)-N(6))-methyltransferase RlmJ [Moraxellaceae bacterium]HQX89847.1 23S rRNA (adenine(2030)-N(6))-methyltransferase RlmJ [Moraxellaceae bacterium]
MNYRHHYHAGNFADVVKHILLLGLLDSLGRKTSPYCYIDTHAGCGLYDLGASAPQKTLEFKSGLSRVKEADKTKAPAWITAYLEAVAALGKERDGFWYPGSPWLALNAMRESDRAILMELHPEDAGKLKQHLSRYPNISIHMRNAYEGLTALIPPQEKRGLVLIDPPYEEERDDYAPVVELLAKAHAKWPTGTYAVWFPIKDHYAITRFYRRLRNTYIPKILTTELCVMPPDNQLSLNGTGMILVNPPWQFDIKARALLSWLTPVLSDHKQASFKVEWLNGENVSAPVKKGDDDED